MIVKTGTRTGEMNNNVAVKKDSILDWDIIQKSTVSHTAGCGVPDTTPARTRN